MKVVITGGAGFIGRATAKRLYEAGHAVYVVDSLQSRVHPSGEWPRDLVEGPRLQGDVRDESTWQWVFDQSPHAILHLAAYQDYMTDYSTFISTNVASTALLYELARERGWNGQVVVASSQATLGEGVYWCNTCELRQHVRTRTVTDVKLGWNPHCETCHATLIDPAWTDEDEARPVTPYGVSKEGEEHIALALGQMLEIPTVALRYSIVQGAGQSPWNAYSGVLRAVSLQLLASRDVILFEDGQQLRDYVSIHDVVAANVLALDGKLPPDAYHVGGNLHWTVSGLAHMMRDISGRNVKITAPGLFRVGDVRHTLSSVAKLMSFGWTPSYSVDIWRSTWEPYWHWLSQLDLNADAIVTTAFEKMKASGVLVQV